MGGVCAAVYLLLMVLFMPFLFYPDIRSATADLKPPDVEGSRVLHRFPLGKVASSLYILLFFDFETLTNL